MTVSQSGTDVKTNFHLFAAGPRFAFRRYPRFTPFFDVLAGVGRGRAGAMGLASTADESTTNLGYLSQFGVAISTTDGSLGLRFTVGDFGVRAGGEWHNNSAFQAGVVIRR